MARRYIALGTSAEPGWREAFERELSMADWHMCAESAGVDDDEVDALVRPLRAVRPTASGPGLLLDFAKAGLLRVEPLTPEQIATVRAEDPGSTGQLPFGLRFSLEGSSGAVAELLLELVQAIAIGLAGENGWVRAPDGAWWDVAGSRWVSPRSG